MWSRGPCGNLGGCSCRGGIIYDRDEGPSRGVASDKVLLLVDVKLTSTLVIIASVIEYTSPAHACSQTKGSEDVQAVAREARIDGVGEHRTGEQGPKRPAMSKAKGSSLGISVCSR